MAQPKKTRDYNLDDTLIKKKKAEQFNVEALEGFTSH